MKFFITMDEFKHIAKCESYQSLNNELVKANFNDGSYVVFKIHSSANFDSKWAEALTGGFN